MNINFTILDAAGKLNKYVNILEEIAKKSINETVNKIPVDNVNIVFYDAKFRNTEGFGFGGYTLTNNLLMIPIDSKFESLEESVKKNLSRLIVHELYHCLRDYSFEGQPTLLESLINEGLADCFEIEISNEKPSLLDTALNENQLQKFNEQAKKEYNNKEYNHDAWFFGTTDDIPKWTGYTLGFFLVKNYLEKHPKEKPSTIYGLKAEEFV